MPMMMEEQTFEEKFDDMDDLFLDPSPELLPLAPLSESVLRRIDDLTVSGCCQKLAWSRAGVLAHITRGGRAVTVQTFRHQHATRDFVLTKPWFLELSPVHEGNEIVHLCWNQGGHDIAIVDSTGTVSIFQNPPSILNRLLLAGRNLPVSNVEDDSVVGLTWLAPNRPAGPQFQARQVGNKWVYKPELQAKVGLAHPSPSKSAVIYVTRGGSLRLLFGSLQPVTDNSYAETRTSLHNVKMGSSRITHASFASEVGSTMLLATYDTSMLVRIYRISVNWQYPFSSKEMPPRSFVLSPTLEVTRLKVLSILPIDCTGHSNQLIHFHTLPAVSGTHTMRETVMAIYGGFQDPLHGGPISRIVQYELRQENEELHASFEQLASKRTKVSTDEIEVSTADTIPPGNADADADIIQQPALSANKLPDCEIHGVAVACSLTKNNTVFVIVQSNGAVIFLDRRTMQPMVRNMGTGVLRSLMDGGFAFPPGEACSQVSLSPNACILAHANDEDEIGARFMDYPQDEDDLQMSLMRDDVAIAAMSLSFATSQAQQRSHDDVLALIRRNQQRVNVESLMEGILASVNIHFDFPASEGPQKLLHNQFIPRCLAVHHSLGIGGPDGMQTVSSKAAWMLISLRQAAWALHIGFSSIQATDVEAPDQIGSLLGIVVWYMDLISMLVNSLFWTSRELKHNTSDTQTAILDLISNPPNFTLPLLFSNMARIFFRNNTRYIRSLVTLTQSQSSPGSYSRQALLDIVSRAPISLARFEQILLDIDHHVKKTYEEAGLGDAAKASAEKSLLITGRVPEVLIPVVQRLVGTTLDKVMEEMKEPGGVMLEGWNGALGMGAIGFGDGGPGDQVGDPGYGNGVLGAGHGGVAWDVLRKVPLFGLKEVRKCTICGSVVENLGQGQQGQGQQCQWVLTLQKACICGSSWVVVDV